MSLKAGEHVVLADVHSPEMMLKESEEGEANELHKVSTTVQPQEMLECVATNNSAPSEVPQLGKISKQNEQVKKIANRFNVSYEKWKVVTK